MHRHARRDGKTAWIAQFRLALPFDIDDETNGAFRIRRQHFESRVEYDLALARRRVFR